MNLDTSVAANTPIDWLVALLVPLVASGIVWLIRFYVKKRLAVLAAATDNVLDDILVDLIGGVNLFIVFVVVAFISSRALVLPESLVPIIKTLAIIAAFAQVAIWGNGLISMFLNRAQMNEGSQRINPSARRAMGYLGRLVLWTLVGALLLENLGVQLSALLAGVGIGGIALALAAQNVLGDIFCYVAIILDKPFIAGDFVIVGEMMGTIERIGIKTTRVRSLFGEQLVFSNHDLVTSRLRNYKTMSQRRVVFSFGVAYETPVESVKGIPEMTREIISSIESTRFDRAHFAKFGDFSLDFEIVYYILDSDYNRYMDIQQRINVELMKRFRDEGIEFAYPTQSLYLKRPERTVREAPTLVAEESDGYN